MRPTWVKMRKAPKMILKSSLNGRPISQRLIKGQAVGNPSYPIFRVKPKKKKIVSF